MAQNTMAPANPQVSLAYGTQISLELAKRMIEAAEVEAQRNGWRWPWRSSTARRAWWCFIAWATRRTPAATTRA